MVKVNIHPDSGKGTTEDDHPTRTASPQATESMARALLEFAPDGIVVVSKDGRIAIVNAQVENMFGYKPEELIGKAIETLIPERFRERHVGHRTKYVSEPRTRPMGVGLELYGRRKDGSEFPVEISLSPTTTESGTFTTAIVRDITDRKRTDDQVKLLNAELQRGTIELEAANRELEAFAYSVSHDLRAPLRAVDGFSQALLEDYGHQLDAEGKEYLARVRAAAQRMGHLIDDLLRLSRITRVEMNREPVDLSAMAGEIAEDMQRKEPERQVELVIAPGMTVDADAHLIRIAIDNLLSNAWKFTNKHSRAKIEVGVTQRDGQPEYYVRDDGAGFDMKYADKMFGPFQRLHSTEEFIGTGIGLAIVQRIMHRHGGRIWAEAEVDRGATFYFTLQPERVDI